ncbi:MAG: SRPBCC domain-containing protein [Ferruginibacter sp.]
MKFNKTILLFSFLFITFFGLQAQVTNSSYITKFGEKALQFSLVVNASKIEVWKLFTTDIGLEKWIAPVVKTNMRIGGWIRTNYDKTKTTDDTTAIQLDIINYLENEMLTLKVNLNDNFPQEAKNDDKYLQEIIQFIDVGKGKTKIISTMVGWGQGSHWDKTYSFFEKGNEWTYEEFLKLFQKVDVTNSKKTTN